MFAGIDAVQVNPRRRWTAIASFTMQAAALAVALVLPLLHPESLPEAFARRPIFVPMSGAELSATPHDQITHGNTGAVSYSHVLIVNRDNGVHFPGSRNETVANEGPPTIALAPVLPSALLGPNLGDHPLPTFHATVVTQPRISRSMQGYLIHRVEPLYPNIAKTAGVQGAVVIKAVISSEGRIEQAQVVSGSPLLAKAALDAIQQWRYRPYLLNDKPVEVETEITVNFYLTR